MGKWSIPCLGEEMCKVSLEHLVIPESKETIKHFGDWVKKNQEPTWGTCVKDEALWESKKCYCEWIEIHTVDAYAWFIMIQKNWSSLWDARELIHYSENRQIRAKNSIFHFFPVWPVPQSDKIVDGSFSLQKNSGYWMEEDWFKISTFQSLMR